MIKKILIIFLLFCYKIGLPQSDNYKQLRLFNKLWSKIDKNYPSFELKEVDWNRTYNLIKPKITPELTQVQLMDTISLMLAPLNDGHVGVSMIKFFPLRVPKDFIAERHSQFYSEFSSDSLRGVLFELTNKTLQSHGFQSLKVGFQHDNSIINFTHSDNIGYLHISKMERISKRDVRRIMSNAVNKLTDSKGLIVDIRDNRGGLDNISDLITSFLIDSTIVARYEQTRKMESYEALTKPKKIEIIPNKVTFTKKIVLITNDRTRSAGEYLVLALKDLAHVTIVGDRTEGMLGGSKIGFLPYGWIYGVNKWKYTSRENIWYEDIGIPPDFFIQNKLSDLDNGVDPIIEKAIFMIENE
jgi:hypothetical protein